MRASESVRESMFTAISQWQSSGLNQQQFCKQQNIRYHVFHYWYKRYRNVAEKTGSAKPRFIALHAPAAGSNMFAEFSLPNGNRIIFHQPVSIDYLKALIQ